jgi:hypothetical protein
MSLTKLSLGGNITNANVLLSCTYREQKKIWITGSKTAIEFWYDFIPEILDEEILYTPRSVRNPIDSAIGVLLETLLKGWVQEIQ